VVAVVATALLLLLLPLPWTELLLMSLVLLSQLLLGAPPLPA
jgi:hypothetical protein